jgi:hypothetical protein
MRICRQDPFTILAIKALDEELDLPDAGAVLDWVNRRPMRQRIRTGVRDPEREVHHNGP